MYRLFEAKTEEEVALVSVISKSKDLKARRKALADLRVLCGLTKNDYLGIIAKEFYDQIPGKPRGWNRFRSASITYNDELIKR